MVARLEDVAREAGVSIATVSRVFNGRPNVAESTRIAVAAAIESLGYDGHPMLGPGHALMVGIVTSDDQCHFNREVIRAMTELLSTRSIATVLLQSAEFGDFDERAIAIFIERRIDGVALIGGRRSVVDVSSAPYALLGLSSVALVTVAGVGQFRGGGGLAVDDSLSVELAARELLSDGHDRIGYIGRRDGWMSTLQKERAFTSFLRSNFSDYPVEGLVERVSATIEGAQLATERILNVGATALICETDWMTVGALRAIKGSGRRVPSDVALVSCLDSPLLRELEPPITAIRQPSAEIGRAAAVELIHQLCGDPAHSGERLFRPELQTRESTERRSVSA